MIKRLKAFADKYRTAVIIVHVLIFTLFSLVGKSQILQRIDAFGYKYKRIQVDSAFYIPIKDTGSTTPTRIGQITLRPQDSTAYIVISITVRPFWQKIGSGSGGSYSIGFGLLANLKVDSAVVSTKLFAQHYADSLRALIRNIYTASGLYAVNDSTFGGDTTILNTRLRSKKIVDSLISLIGTVFGNAFLANNQSFTGQNTFTNDVFLTGNNYNSDVTKTKILIEDTVTKKIGHQSSVYVDLTGIADGDHLKWNSAGGKLVDDNANYFSSASSGNIPYGTGISWTTGNLNWSGRLLHLNGAQAGIELSSTRTFSPNYMLLAANSTYTYPFNIIDTIHGVTSTLRFAIGTNGEIVLPGGQVIKKANVGNINYNIQPTDYLINFVSLSAARNVNASATPPLDGQVFIVKDETGTAGANNITFVGTLDGVTNPVIINTNYGSKRIYYSTAATAYFSLN